MKANAYLGSKVAAKIALRLVLLCCELILAVRTYAQTSTNEASPISIQELAAISERGRMLAEYDTAAWNATDAVRTLKPDETKVRRYLARKTEDGWIVVFGKLNDEQSQFLISYEATAQSAGSKFRAKALKNPRVDDDFYLRAARATDIAFAAFGTPSRPYNVAALVAPEGQWWVYLVPAPAQFGVWPLGGDVRYLISSDGKQIRETRRLHKGIIEAGPIREGKAEAGYHTHVLSSVPEDTDVFFVLTRQPRVPEYVMAGDFMYKIETNGVVRFLMTHEEFQKMK
jgi:hypothetical protein